MKNQGAYKEHIASFHLEELRLYHDIYIAFKEKNYFVMTPARSRRYEILLEFAEEKTMLYEEEVREALTLDYYLREVPKSRPDFVKNVPAKGRIDTSTRDPLTGNFRLVN